MLYEVEFAFKNKNSFSIFKQAFIFAMSLKEVKEEAADMIKKLPESKKHDIHIFIGEPSC